MIPAMPLPLQGVSTALSGLPTIETGSALVETIRNGEWLTGALSGIGPNLAPGSIPVDPVAHFVSLGVGWLLENVRPLSTWLNDLTGDAAEVELFAQSWTKIGTDLHGISSGMLTRLGELNLMSGDAVAAYQNLQTEAAYHLQAAGDWANGISEGMRSGAAAVEYVHDLVKDALTQLAQVAVKAAAASAATFGFLAPAAPGVVAKEAIALALKLFPTVTNLVDSVSTLSTQFNQLQEVMSTESTAFSTAVKGRPATYTPTYGSLNSGVGSLATAAPRPVIDPVTFTAARGTTMAADSHMVTAPSQFGGGTASGSLLDGARPALAPRPGVEGTATSMPAAAGAGSAAAGAAAARTTAAGAAGAGARGVGMVGGGAAGQANAADKGSKRAGVRSAAAGAGSVRGAAAGAGARGAAGVMGGAPGHSSAAGQGSQRSNARGGAAAGTGSARATAAGAGARGTAGVMGGAPAQAGAPGNGSKQQTARSGGAAAAGSARANASAAGVGARGGAGVMGGTAGQAGSAGANPRARVKNSKKQDRRDETTKNQRTHERNSDG